MHFLFYLAALLPASRLIEELVTSQPVVCDRYLLSTLLYHRAIGADVEAVDLSRLSLCQPDCTVCLTTDETVRQERIRARHNRSRSDPTEVMSRVLVLVDGWLVTMTPHVFNTAGKKPEQVSVAICQQLGLAVEFDHEGS